ncbi:mucin-2-like [Ornithodoros turicata]|uniref:mucin-2-like n=1 Tax=Ornithodoros turicata TaxID=34597 RepID=UPI0031391B0E
MSDDAAVFRGPSYGKVTVLVVALGVTLVMGTAITAIVALLTVIWDMSTRKQLKDLEPVGRNADMSDLLSNHTTRIAPHPGQPSTTRRTMKPLKKRPFPTPTSRKRDGVRRKYVTKATVTTAQDHLGSTLKNGKRIPDWVFFKTRNHKSTGRQSHIAATTKHHAVRTVVKYYTRWRTRKPTEHQGDITTTTKHRAVRTVVKYYTRWRTRKPNGSTGDRKNGDSGATYRTSHRERGGEFMRTTPGIMWKFSTRRVTKQRGLSLTTFPSTMKPKLTTRHETAMTQATRKGPRWKFYTRLVTRKPVVRTDTASTTRKPKPKPFKENRTSVTRIGRTRVVYCTRRKRNTVPFRTRIAYYTRKIRKSHPTVSETTESVGGTRGPAYKGSNNGHFRTRIVHYTRKVRKGKSTTSTGERTKGRTGKITKLGHVPTHYTKGTREDNERVTTTGTTKGPVNKTSRVGHFRTRIVYYTRRIKRSSATTPMSSTTKDLAGKTAKAGHYRTRIVFLTRRINRRRTTPHTTETTKGPSDKTAKAGHFLTRIVYYTKRIRKSRPTAPMVKTTEGPARESTKAHNVVTRILYYTKGIGKRSATTPVTKRTKGLKNKTSKGGNISRRAPYYTRRNKKRVKTTAMNRRIVSKEKTHDVHIRKSTTHYIETTKETRIQHTTSVKLHEMSDTNCPSTMPRTKTVQTPSSITDSPTLHTSVAGDNEEVSALASTNQPITSIPLTTQGETVAQTSQHSGTGVSQWTEFWDHGGRATFTEGQQASSSSYTEAVAATPFTKSTEDKRDSGRVVVEVRVVRGSKKSTFPTAEGFTSGAGDSTVDRRTESGIGPHGFDDSTMRITKYNETGEAWCCPDKLN